MTRRITLRLTEGQYKALVTAIYPEMIKGDRRTPLRRVFIKIQEAWKNSVKEQDR